MDVTMPDGTVLSGVPEGTTKSQIMARYSKFQPSTPAQTPQGPTNSAQTAEDIKTALTQSPETGGMIALERIGGAGMGMVNRAIGDALPQPIKDAGKYIGDKFQAGAQNVADAIDSPTTEDKAVGAGKALSGFAKDHPVITGTAKDLANLATFEPLAEGANAVRAGLGRAGENAAANLARPEMPDTRYLTSDAQKALFRTDTDARTHINDLYSWRDKMAAGKISDAKHTAPTLDAIINDARSKIANPSVEDSVVGKLEDIKSRISPDGRIALSDLTDLDKFYNNLGESQRFSDSPALGAARDAVKKDLALASKYHPEFGDAYNASNTFFENYARNFKNDVMTSIYHPEDTKNLDAFFRGTMGDVPAETKQRAENFFDNIYRKGVTGYQEVVSKLSPQDRAAFDDEFKNYIKENYGANKLGTVINWIKSPVKQTIKAATTQGPDTGADFLAAQKGKLPYNYGSQGQAFPDAINESKAKLQELQNFQKSGGYQTSPYGPGFTKGHGNLLPSPTSTPKALPAPDTGLVSSSEPHSVTGGQNPYADDMAGRPGPMTPEQRDAALKLRQSQDAKEAIAARADLPNPYQGWDAGPQTELQHYSKAISDIRAWDKANYELSNKGFTHKEIVNKIGQRPDVPPYPLGKTAPVETKSPAPSQRPTTSNMSIPERFVNSGPSQKDLDDLLNFQNPKFARGGAVNKNPTDGQKLAGNYKKGHTKVHGLDITIENPKGSVRKGKSENGTEWSVKMPVDYGYIRRVRSGNDGDHMDCFVGPNHSSNRVYVIHQKHLHNNKFDEHKCMIGFTSREDAERAYRQSFSDGKGGKRIMKIERMDVKQFKDWLKGG